MEGNGIEEPRGIRLGRACTSWTMLSVKAGQNKPVSAAASSSAVRGDARSLARSSRSDLSREERALPCLDGACPCQPEQRDRCAESDALWPES